MTLILALGNPHQVIQISDRRLTSNGRVSIQPENKTTFLHLQDARILCGFTGLARAGSFRTAQWVLDTLLGCVEPDDLAFKTLERFTDRATEEFQKNPA